MLSSKIKVLALSVLVLGAATYAYACGDNDKTSNTQASYSSADGATCAGKMSKEACAAKMAAGQCSAHGAMASNAGAGGTCSMAKGASMAAGSSCGMKSAAMAQCVYGENTVTMAGTCPAGNDADYSFAIAGAECQGTGAAAAKAIKSVKGVASVTVDYDKHMAYVCADKRATNSNAIAKSLKKAGFDGVRFVSDSKANCARSHGKIDA
ncbi:MAG: heavy metal-associated domain-containing protein [Candidatus Eisenbacteria bacterium]